MKRKPYRKQHDRFLKQLTYVERQRQLRIRTRIAAEYPDVLLYA